MRLYLLHIIPTKLKQHKIMEKSPIMKIAAISTYGTLSLSGKRYQAILLYQDINDLKKKLKTYIGIDFLMGTMIQGIHEEFADLNPFETLENIKGEVEEAISAGVENDRLVISLPEILTDFHIEFLGEIGEGEKWLFDAEEAGIMAVDIPEGCAGSGEFLQVVQLVNPSEDSQKEFEVMERYTNTIEKWDNFLSEEIIVNIFK